jgi:Flp pilus assembly protein TadD
MPVFFGEERTAEALPASAVDVHRSDVLLLYALGEFLERQRRPRLAEAIEHYRAAAAARPELGARLGLALVRAGRAAKGEAVLRDLVRRDPGNADRHFQLGYALAAQEKLGEAEAAFRKVVKLRPDFPEARTDLGVVLRAQGKLREAVAACRTADQLAPGQRRIRESLREPEEMPRKAGPE